MEFFRYFSWRQNLLYTLAALAGVLATQKYILGNPDPSIGIIIGVPLGINIGSMIQAKRTGKTGFDDLNKEIVDNAMIHGFITYTCLLGYQLFAAKSFPPTEVIITTTTVMIASLIVQALTFIDKVGDKIK